MPYEGFVHELPSQQPLPKAAWIKPPKMATSDGKLQEIQPPRVSKSLANCVKWLDSEAKGLQPFVC